MSITLFTPLMLNLYFVMQKEQVFTIKDSVFFHDLFFLAAAVSAMYCLMTRGNAYPLIFCQGTATKPFAGKTPDTSTCMNTTSICRCVNRWVYTGETATCFTRLFLPKGAAIFLMMAGDISSEPAVSYKMNS
jgi:hypothetical protein